MISREKDVLHHHCVEYLSRVSRAFRRAEVSESPTHSAVPQRSLSLSKPIAVRRRSAAVRRLIEALCCASSAELSLIGFDGNDSG